MDEEVVLLEEQLAVANADVGRLQGRVGELESAVAGREADAVALRGELAAARDGASRSQSALAAREEETQALRQDLEASAQDLLVAANRYRELLLAAEPELPVELIHGATVSEIDESAARARQTVAQVRQHLEQQAHSLRVPAGAPARGVADVGNLTPAEKIRLGLRAT